MVIRPRTRKRVQAVRRAADGSAFEKWYCSKFFASSFRFPWDSSRSVILCFGVYFSEECGDMIAIALFDMHECGERKWEVKRFKCISSGKIDNNSKPNGSFEDEPRSPFIFFWYSNQNLPLSLSWILLISTQFLGLCV